MSGIILLVLNGCAGQTTDPRHGGLFSYDPAAYQQRLDERKSRLTKIEQDTAAQKHKSAKLKRDLATQKNKLKQ